MSSIAEARCLDLFTATISRRLGGNVLVLINEVVLRRARLVPGWVTISGEINLLSAEIAVHVYSAWSLINHEWH